VISLLTEDLFSIIGVFEQAASKNANVKIIRNEVIAFFILSTPLFYYIF
jgi:hypothetical protein